MLQQQILNYPAKNKKLWKKLKSLIIPDALGKIIHQTGRPQYFDLVHVLVDENKRPLLYSQHPDDVPSLMVFTDVGAIYRMDKTFQESELLQGCHHQKHSYTSSRQLDYEIFTIGELMNYVPNKEQITAIKVNPISYRFSAEEFPIFLCEEVLFVPLFDPRTQKYMMTSPDKAMALLALDPFDQKRFGVEITFHAYSPSDLPSEETQRTSYIQQQIEKLHFYIARTIQKKGSASFYCVLLNLESKAYEYAFIREYQTFNRHISPIFVTSSLQLLSGQLDNIDYDGKKINTVLMPLIEWHKKRKLSFNYE